MLKQFDNSELINDYLDRVTVGSFLVDDIKILGKYIKRLKAGDKYLEIGTARGKSIASAVFQAEEGVIFYTCDIVDGLASAWNCSRADFFKREKINSVCTFILKESTQLAKTWKNGELSMIFIDGDHSYESVKNDIISWTPHLKKGGYMLFHDYGDFQFPVYLAVDELVKNSNQFSNFFIASNLGLHSSIAGGTKT